MKSFRIYLIVIFIGFLAGCSCCPTQVIIDDFEGDLNSKTVDFGSSDNSSLKVEASKELKVSGEQSIKLTYDLATSGYMWVARGFNLDVKGANAWETNPEDLQWNKYNALSVSMHGSNSGAVIAFDVRDAGGELWRYLLDDDFDGWKEITCLLANFFPRKDWQPDTAIVNEVMDFPIMSFQFEPRLPGKGVLYFDCIKVIRIKN